MLTTPERCEEIFDLIQTTKGDRDPVRDRIVGVYDDAINDRIIVRRYFSTFNHKLKKEIGERLNDPIIESFLLSSVVVGVGNELFIFARSVSMNQTDKIKEAKRDILSAVSFCTIYPFDNLFIT